jgi:DNA invertase Pin-like site-specific DNA recombinase
LVAADCPNDDRMMLQMRPVFAEEEARKISIRPAALAVAKARGVKLCGYRGAPPPDAAACAASIATRRLSLAYNGNQQGPTLAALAQRKKVCPRPSGKVIQTGHGSVRCA